MPPLNPARTLLTLFLAAQPLLPAAHAQAFSNSVEEMTETSTEEDFPVQASAVAAFSGSLRATAAPTLCIDVAGSSQANGAPLQIWGCNSTGAQAFTYHNGLLRAFANRCLDVKEGRNVNGTEVQTWDCWDGSPNQKWVAENGRLRWLNTNKCLDLPRGNRQFGTHLQIWDCTDGNVNQQWTIPGVGAAPDPTPAQAASAQGSGFVPAGYNLVWSDEFNGAQLDRSKWNVEVNCDGGGNNEQQCYVDSPKNIFLENGHLVIRVVKENYNGKSYTSGRINSSKKGDFRTGYFESRLKVPCGQGFWPAYWMLPTDSAYGTWPASGEIDIMEILGGSPQTLHGTNHFGPAWPNNKEATFQTGLSSGNFCGDYHVFGAQWEPTQITFYLDGRAYGQQQASGGYDWGSVGHWPFDQRFYTIFNVAMGGNWPGNPDAGITSGQMEVDYVRAYSR